MMRIATWNVNSVRVRLPHVLDFLRRHDIDVMLLQELKCAPELFPVQDFDDVGYNSVFYCQKAYNGVAILSRYIIEDVVDGSSIFEDNTQTRYIEALINGFIIASIYVPNGQDRANVEPGYPYLYKIGFMKKLTEHVISNGYDKQKFIIGGDFNITRDERDTYDPKIWDDARISCTPLERRSLHDFMTQVDLNDAMRQYECYDFTWFDYRMNSFVNNKGLRIDYIFTSRPVVVTNCFTDKEYRGFAKPSDHVPVIAEIDC